MKPTPFLCAIIATAMFSGGFATAATPANDHLAKAAALPGPYSQVSGIDLSSATADPLDPFLDGAKPTHTVWFSFTPTAKGQLSVTYDDPSGVRAGLFLALDPENPTGSLKREAETNNAIAGGTEMLNINVEAGRKIFLVLDGTGTLGLTHRFSAVDCPNDFPSTAIALNPPVRGIVPGNNLLATNTADEPDVLGNLPSSRTLWYRWTPNFTDKAGLDTNFSAVNGGIPGAPQSWHDTTLSLFREESDGTLTLLAADFDSGYQSNSRLTFPAVAGVTYLIGVGTKPGSPSGDFTLYYYRANSGGKMHLPYTSIGSRREGEGPFTFFVRRLFGGDVSASCKVATTMDGTATSNVDYTAFSKTLTFTNSGADTDWEMDVSLVVLTDPDTNPVEELFVTLLPTPTGAADTKLCNFFIFDQTFPGYSFLRPDQYEIRVRENVNEARIPVHRDGGDTTALSLTTEFDEGAAKLVQDFLPIQFLGSIGAGASSGEARVKIVDDNAFEPEESFEVTLNDLVTCVIIVEDDDPYIPVPGRLTGMLSYANSTRSAMLSATISSTGFVTGRLSLVGHILPYKGQLDERGRLKAYLALKGRKPLILTLAARDEAGSFAAELFDGETLASDFETARIQTYSAKSTPSPYAGYYTLFADGPGGGFGGAAAGLKVSKTGAVRGTGKLLTGASFSFAGGMDGGTGFSAIARLPGGRGSLGFDGTIPFLPGAISSGLWLQYNLPARSNDPTRLGPLVGGAQGNVARYTPPTPGQRIIEVWENNGGMGKATLSRGGLPTNLDKPLTITANNVIGTPTDAEKLQLTVAGKSGFFRGSVTPMTSSPACPIVGVFLQGSGMNGKGRGLFLNGAQGGGIQLAKP